MRAFRSRLAAACWPLAIAACSGEDDTAAVSSSSTTTATGGTGGAATTTGTGGEGGAGGGQGGGGAAPCPAPAEPEPFPVAEWMVGKVYDAAKDQVLPAIEQGTFDLPAAGQSLGVNWAPVVPGEGGALVTGNTDLVYAVARVTVPPCRRLFARGDTVAGFYVNNAVRQPGDFYHSKAMRVPLGTKEGDNLIVVRALGRRNVPEVELWSTGAELVVNPQDLTAPQLAQGSTGARPVGVAVLSLRDEATADVTARVLEDETFAETAVAYPSLAPGAVTQVSFLLQPKAAIQASEEPLTAKVRLESPGLAWPYEQEIQVQAVAAGARRRVTRESKVDGSTQYYALMPPAGAQAGQSYGLVLSLHGAGVEALGQANAYSPKDWAYLAAATNRRPFGFDWEEWGRLDALETLAHATETLGIDPERVHLTGHSMGGHGTWHVGVHFSDWFGVVAPSAGWISFETYGGTPPPEGPVGRARAASQTLDYVENFAKSSVYIIHGSKDTNVPVSHAKTMYETLLPITPKLAFHEQPGADHWWDLDPNEEGADCVDWEPMIAVMKDEKRELLPLDFVHRSPAPWVRSTHSYVDVRSVVSPMQDYVVESVSDAEGVSLTTTNVRSLVIDGAALAAKGVATVTVNGEAYQTSAGTIAVGPEDGKTPDRSGPLNQVFQRPFCFVWPDDGPAVYRRYASFLLSWWSVIGNGHGSGVPLSGVTDTIRASKNLVYVGVPKEQVEGGDALPLAWDAEAVTIDGKTFHDAAVAFVFPVGARLDAFIAATAGSENLLYRYVPWSSRAGMPDFFVYDADGLSAAGFFDAEWALDPAFAIGL